MKPRPDTWDSEIDGEWADQPGALIHSENEQENGEEGDLPILHHLQVAGLEEEEKPQRLNRPLLSATPRPAEERKESQLVENSLRMRTETMTW